MFVLIRHITISNTTFSIENRVDRRNKLMLGDIEIVIVLKFLTLAFKLASSISYEEKRDIAKISKFRYELYCCNEDIQTIRE